LVPQVATAIAVPVEPDAAQRADEHLGERPKPQAQLLIGSHAGGAGAAREHVGLARLDAVLHVAARVHSVLAIARRGSDQPSRVS
jgi:hypothetical protein